MKHKLFAESGKAPFVKTSEDGDAKRMPEKDKCLRNAQSQVTV